MNHRFPQCYNLVFSTYGTRLLGDERGATRWDGTRVLRCDPLKEYMEDHLNDQVFTMSFEQRAIAHDAIFDSAFKHRFYIDALNVRTNHIHLVVCSLDGLSSSEVVRFIKNDVVRALESTFERERIERIWTKSFAKTAICEIGGWRGFVQYALLRQGSNDYMARTKFAARVGLTNPNNPTALRAAFNVEINARFRMTLFAQMKRRVFDDQAREDSQT